MSRPIVSITSYDGENEIFVGEMIPPAGVVRMAEVNPTGQDDYYAKTITMLWNLWREEVEEIASDSDFCNWLVNRGCGWKYNTKQSIFQVRVEA